MLITLLAMRIVANNIFGASINLIISWCFLIDDSFILFLSVGDNPKKAISEPDISPEAINNTAQDKKGVKKL